VLKAHLNGSYSLALYGEQGGVDPHVRVIWPSLLSATGALDFVRLRCSMPASAAENDVAIFYDWPEHRNFLQHGALWLHRPLHQLAAAHEDDAWIEVVHCAYTNGVTITTPMYFLHAPGSGLRLNVGRSLRMHQIHDGDTDPHFAVHRAVDRGDITQAGALLGMDLSSYDSIQFPLYTTESWKSEHFTEVAMLRWHSERDHVSAHLSHFRCGPLHALRECTAHDPAVSQMAGTCSGPVPREVTVLSSRSGCDDDLRGYRYDDSDFDRYDSDFDKYDDNDDDDDDN